MTSRAVVGVLVSTAIVTAVVLAVPASLRPALIGATVDECPSAALACGSYRPGVLVWAALALLAVGWVVGDRRSQGGQQG